MVVEKVSLLGFRNLKQGEVFLSPGLNLLHGDNAQGKTNFLEAVYLSATGRSLRTRQDKEMIAFGESDAHVQTFVKRDRRTDRIDVHLKKEGKKGIALNGVPLRRSSELFGVLHPVIFSPEDLQLIKNAPSQRRRFIDMEICQLSGVYYHSLQQYYHVLKQRNFLLKNLRYRKDDLATLPVWDAQLASYGVKIQQARGAFVAQLGELAAQAHSRISGGKEVLSLVYKQNTPPEELEERLRASLDRDILLGQTTPGPHRDDILFLLDGQEVRTFGSQGQQRTAALSAKLAEIALIRRETQENPVLLLDDVLSELDDSRQRYLWDSVGEVQTILTCTGMEDKLLQTSGIQVFQVKDGVIV